MMEDNNNLQENTNSESGFPEVNKPQKNFKIGIVGYNMIALAAYTIIFGLAAKQGGVIFDALFIFAHVLVGIVLAIAYRSWMWLLSALMVLIIGFSTCAGMLSIGGGIG
jgi:hypothetical protein